MKLIKTGSQTAMLRTLELLNSHGIPARRSKTGDNTDGCVFAVAVADYDIDRALTLMRSAGLRGQLAGGRP